MKLDAADIAELRPLLAEVVRSTLTETAGATSQRFLTVSQAADYSGLSDESIRRLLSVGKLTALRPVRGRIVIDRHAIDAFVLSADARPRFGRGRR